MSEYDTPESEFVKILDGAAIAGTAASTGVMPLAHRGVDGLAGQVLEAGQVDAESRVSEDLADALGRVVALAARGADDGDAGRPGVFPGHTHKPPPDSGFYLISAGKDVKTKLHCFPHMGTSWVKDGMPERT